MILYNFINFYVFGLYQLVHLKQLFITLICWDPACLQGWHVACG